MSKKVPLVHICFSSSTAGHFHKFCRAVNLKISLSAISASCLLLASSQLRALAVCFSVVTSECHRAELRDALAGVTGNLLLSL